MNYEKIKKTIFCRRRQLCCLVGTSSAKAQEVAVQVIW